ncbi:hypothetical protein HanXRQr2_Chr12g0547281 [Helianthus annuus]|uniref:Uncharacterized protein n=1 Tax=Helianthus annuus TaxID=4232 RepID=A0A251STQ3_HELAN|nr:hypothetical protein HanXRQr2_Chr12g0547281 [Helianthus annuus]KAJ0863164.1 hypothetical protein HanPSC8_Chr12g0526761 [Helianthus annuus]
MEFFRRCKLFNTKTIIKKTHLCSCKVHEFGFGILAYLMVVMLVMFNNVLDNF